ncbi:MAG: PBS lyase HEAT-like repeat protein [Euryarchaeota archaeon ADurb.Bin294]|nr:MAG: PBS lyase HEAT-like repeat protein [Euryarchaeota archaeon ADurb.Bin294]
MGKQRRKEKTVVVDQDREYLQHFADREERKAAAEALAKCTGDDSYPALITALKDDSDSCVRISAARALAERKEPHAIEQIILAFNNALTYEEITKFELEEYAQILGKLGDPTSVSALINSLSTDRTEVRKIIMDILFNYVGQDTMPSLFKALENQDYRILTGAASVLSRKGYKVTDPLMKALTSSHPSVRRGAAMALGDLKFKKSVGPLIAALKDNDPAVVQEVERSLGRIGLPGVDRLVGSLADPDRRIRLASTRVLGCIDFENADKDTYWEKTISTAITGLLPVTMDEDQEVRKSAFLLLGSLGGLLDKQRLIAGNFYTHNHPLARKVRDILIKGRSNDDAHVRAWATEALGFYDTFEASVKPRARRPSRMGSVTFDFDYISKPHGSPPDSCTGDTQETVSNVDIVLDTTPIAPDEKRHVDVAFFHDDQITRVTEEQPLVEDQWYRLKIIVTPHPTGITSAENGRPAIREPDRDRDVTIMVVAEVDDDDFNIEENVQSFILPPSGATEPAWFRIQPKKETPDRENLAEISIKLLCDFFVIEMVTLRAEVIEMEDKPPVSKLRLKPPIRLEYGELERDMPEIGSTVPRDMTVFVKKENDRYFLRFLFKNEEKNKICFPAALRFDENELERELIETRTLWKDIAMSKEYLQMLTCDDEDYWKHVRNLAERGSNLWSRLFKYDTDSSLFHIGKWLEEHPLPNYSTIQILPENKDTIGFIFPWALLYDKKMEEKPDPLGFWGLRYCIEQRVIDRPSISDNAVKPVYSDKLRLGFMMWNHFENSKKHIEMFQNLADTSGFIEEPSPIIDASECILQMKKADWDILYFYSHGHTKPRKTIVGLEDHLEQFIRDYNTYENTDIRKTLFYDLHWALTEGQFEKNKTYIELTNGKIYLDDLYKDDNLKLNRTKPIVFLNMCESAQVIPNLEKSFIHIFLNRGASCVIGTECPMPSMFACPYAIHVFKGLLNGDSVGLSALKASSHFMKEKHNPLGLAYTIYGSVTHSFKPPPIQQPALTNSTGQPSGNV